MCYLYYGFLISIIPQIYACAATQRSGVSALANCPSCDVSTLSGSSFTPTTSENPGTAYFLRGVDPVNWCDTAQINCLTEDGSAKTVRIDVLVSGTATPLATGCGEANSATNALLCNSNNQWTFNGRTDFTVQCHTVTASTCTP